MGQLPSRLDVHPFTLSTSNIFFGEWIPILTVALAPLIAHIAAGTPQPSILTKRASQGPKWHDSMCLHNPTSILWRYAAIADRRIRARNWSVEDMAAANAIFWMGTPTKKKKKGNTSTGYAQVGGREENQEKTPQQRAQDPECAQSEEDDPHEEQGGGWNGTEEMVLASLPYCTELPLRARAEFLSWATITTIIITLQGIQSLVALGNGARRTARGDVAGFQDGVDMLYGPFTILGLFRLCAAGYLTSTGFAYTARDDVWTISTVGRVADEHAGAQGTDGAGLPHLRQHDSRSDHAAASGAAAREPNQRSLTTSGNSGSRYRPTSYLPSVLFRCAYMLFLLLTWVLAILRGTPMLTDSSGVWVRSTTTALSGSFYFFFTSCTCVLFAVYFWRGATRSTIIPCVGTLWYKIYTVIVFLCMFAMLVVACCETSRLPCGQYTSSGEKYWNGRTDCETKVR